MRTPFVPTTTQSPRSAAAGHLEDVAPQERLATRQDRQAFRRERGDFVDHPEAVLGAELTPVGEVLRADQRSAAGVEIAVLAGEVAAVGEVPGDDVGPDEGSRIHWAREAHMPKKSRAASSIFSSTSKDPLSRANFSMPVFAMGRTNSGMFASRASAAAVHRTGMGRPRHARRPSSVSSRKTDICRPPPLKLRLDPRKRYRREGGRGRSARRATGRAVSRMDWSASPSRSRTQGTSRRPRASRPRAAQRSAASSGCRRGRRGTSSGILRHSSPSRSRCAVCSRARPTGVSGTHSGIPRSQSRASSGSNGTVPRQGISRSDGSAFAEASAAKSGLMALQSRQ